VSLNFINIAENVLIIATSLRKNISISEYIFILIDGTMVVYFTLKCVILYLKHKGKASAKIKDVIDLQLLEAVVYQQNRSCLVIPYPFFKTIFEIMRILVLFLFFRYELIFGWTFMIFNVVTLLFSLWYYKKYKGFHVCSFFFFILSDVCESILFAVLGFYCIKSEELRNNEIISSVLIIFIFTWILFSVLSVMIQVFKSACN